MKNNNSNRLSFDEYKNTIDQLIVNKKINKFRLQENYFDICGNYWLIDKYIATDGVFNEGMTPNTLDTYSEAIKNNYAISIPVQMLDDENIVCFAHQNISKIIPSTSGYLKKLSLPEVKQLNLNEKEDKIPTLEEALNHIANKTPIIIEIINNGMVEKFEDKVITLLQNYINKYDCYENVAVMSINPLTLEYFYEHYPYITRILKSGLFTEKMYGSFKTRKLRKLKYFKMAHSDIVAYSAELLPCIAVEKNKPIATIAYNVTNQKQYIALAEHCDNIMFKNFNPSI